MSEEQPQLDLVLRLERARRPVTTLLAAFVAIVSNASSIPAVSRRRLLLVPLAATRADSRWLPPDPRTTIATRTAGTETLDGRKDRRVKSERRA